LYLPSILPTGSGFRASTKIGSPQTAEKRSKFRPEFRLAPAQFEEESQMKRGLFRGGLYSVVSDTPNV
jgi:hypothetical protein